jgi:hypothetical protein
MMWSDYSQRRTKVWSRFKLFKLSLLTLLAAIIAVDIFSTSGVSAFSGGPPPSYTGAPGESTCVSCHSSFPLNSGGGSFTITGLPANYSPGQEITITVALTQSNRELYGFQLTALDDAGRRAGTFVLTLADTSRMQTVNGVVGGNSRSYIEHTHNGTSPSGPNEGRWTFRWRAPATSVGRVTFYAAGNAANGDGTSIGDFVYTRTAVMQPAQPAPTITRLNPTSVAAGGPAFTLIVAGSGFVNGSVLRWNNADRMTSVISETQLTASILATDIASAGSANVTVVNPGSAPSNALTFTIASSGAEADVAPRDAADGSVTINDWVQVGRFVVGLDAINEGSEFQRADCAPRNTLGDGRISVIDFVQASRYAAGLDTNAPAGGPTSPISTATAADERRLSLTESEAQVERKRIVRVASAKWGADRSVLQIIQLEAQGGERAVGFSLNYDPHRLRFASVILNRELSRATFIINAEQAKDGQIGVLFSLPAGQTLGAGAWALMAMRFVAIGGDSLVGAEARFGDEPIAREVADDQANPLLADFESSAPEPSSQSSIQAWPQNSSSAGARQTSVCRCLMRRPFNRASDYKLLNRNQRSFIFAFGQLLLAQRRGAEQSAHPH